MFTAILLSIILNGYIVIRFTTYHFIRLHRFKGQLLYLKTVALGASTYLVACYLTFHFKMTWLSGQFKINPSLLLERNFENIKSICVLALVSLLIAVIWTGLTELYYMLKVQIKSGLSIEFCQLRKKTKIYLTYELLKDSPLDAMLFESMANDIYLLISMMDRKCYVGRVVNLGEPNELEGPDQEILIVPIASGYRKEDTLQLKLTTSYSLADSLLTIALKQHNITSACQYYDELYKQVSEQNAGSSENKCVF